MNLLELVAKISLDSSDYQKGLSKVGSAMGTVAKVGATAIAGATTAVVAFGASAVSAGKDFDSAMSQVGATMGFSVDELNDATSEASKTMETLRNFAQEMGSTTAFSATEASEALNYMALAGYDAEKSMSMLPNVLNLASAGGMDLARASDMVTDAQTALGLSMKETTVMVDQMAMASSKSNTSVEQLGDAILTIGANAKGMAGGTEEIATVLGVLADNGIKGSEAGTHLRNVLLSLGQRSDKIREDLGVDVYDEATGKMRDTRDILLDMSKAMEGWTDEAKDAWLTTENFNKTDLSALKALMDTDEVRWKELGGYIDKAKGSAENMAKVQLDNLEGDITLFKSALEGVQIAVSDMVTPALREFVQMASDGLGEIAEKLRSGDIEGAFGVIGEALGTFANKIAESLPSVVNAGIELIKAFVKGIMDNRQMIIQSAISIVMTLVEDLLTELPQLIEVGLEALVQFLIGIAEALPTMIPTIVDVVLTIVDTLINNVDLLIDGAIALILGLADGLINALPMLAERIPEIVLKIVFALIENAPKLWNASFQLILALADGLVKYWGTLLTTIPKLVTQIVDKFKSFASNWRSIGTDIVAQLWEGLKARWDQLVSDAKEKAKSLVDALKGIFGGASDSSSGSGGGGSTRGMSTANFSSYDSGSYGVQSLSNQNLTVVLQGDADRLFRLVQEQSSKNVRLTGQPSF